MRNEAQRGVVSKSQGIAGRIEVGGRLFRLKIVLPVV